MPDARALMAQTLATEFGLPILFLRAGGKRPKYEGQFEVQATLDVTRIQRELGGASHRQLRDRLRPRGRLLRARRRCRRGLHHRQPGARAWCATRHLAYHHPVGQLPGPVRLADRRRPADPQPWPLRARARRARGRRPVGRPALRVHRPRDRRGAGLGMAPRAPARTHPAPADAGALAGADPPARRQSRPRPPPGGRPRPRPGTAWRPSPPRSWTPSSPRSPARPTASRS